MSKIRALVAEDQELSRERLVALLREEPDVEVVAACSDGRQAAEAIQRLQPDLVFLDMQMPELDGFDVIESVGAEQMPTVIFVTAYDEYALRAFEVHALDYLLKPFGKRRLQKALQRARGQLQSRRTEALAIQLLALVSDLKLESERPGRILIRSGGRISFLPLDQIDWVEAEGNYVRLHVGDESHLLRETMSAMEQRLGPDRFVRVHRSRLAQIKRIKELRVKPDGTYEAVLVNGVRLNVGRAFREELQERLQRE